MIICTSICANYLPKAMVMARSAKENIQGVKVVVCLLERQLHPAAADFEYFDDVVLAKDMGFDDFESFIFKHSIVEAATSVKGQLFSYLMNTYKDEEKFVYLDPDIQVMGNFEELNRALDDNPIVLTPHLCDPEEHLDGIMDNELCALQHGVFNLGFLAVRRSEIAERFINWWKSRLEKFCYDDIPRGIFTDQKWMDLSPCFFDIFIFKHPGYNTAPWNLSRRKVSTDKDSKYLVNGQPLRFFHFSGFDSGDNEAMINKYVPDLQNAVYTLRNEYVKLLNKMGQAEMGSERWSYDCFNSGEKINKASRIVYRISPGKYPNPFSLANKAFLGAWISKETVTLLKKNVKKLIRK